MSLLTSGLVLGGFAPIVGADHGALIDARDHMSRKVVCVASDAMVEVACATATLGSAVYCYGGSPGYYCTINSILRVATVGARANGTALGTAWSEATHGTQVEALSGESVHGATETVTLHASEIDFGGSVMVFSSTVCVRFAVVLDDTGSASTADGTPVCETWEHAVYVPPDHCGLFNCELQAGIRLVQYGEVAGSSSVETVSSGPDNSSAAVCGTTEAEDVGCGAGRLLHSAPECAGSSASRTCTVDYWFELRSPARGCVQAATDQFEDGPVQCAGDVTDGFMARLVGPFTGVYDNIPESGLDIVVEATLCLGDDDQRGFHGDPDGRCTTWSPATIHLSGV